MASLRTLIDRLGELFDQDDIPHVDYVDLRPVMPNLNALTKQEREWLEQAQREDEING